jgi:hypothetical protein
MQHKKRTAVGLNGTDSRPITQAFPRFRDRGPSNWRRQGSLPQHCNTNEASSPWHPKTSELPIGPRNVSPTCRAALDSSLHGVGSGNTSRIEAATYSPPRLSTENPRRAKETRTRGWHNEGTGKVLGWHLMSALSIRICGPSRAGSHVLHRCQRRASWSMLVDESGGNDSTRVS